LKKPASCITQNGEFKALTADHATTHFASAGLQKQISEKTIPSILADSFNIRTPLALAHTSLESAPVLHMLYRRALRCVKRMNEI
jgi:hypothetical protein